MTTEQSDQSKFHGTFLLILAIAVSVLFVRMIQDFVITLVLAAIFAGLTYPLYLRIVKWLGGRKPLASLVTVVLVMLCVILPLLVFLGLVAEEALAAGKSAEPWVKQHMADPGGVDRLVEKIPFAEHLAPYKDRILEKVSQAAGALGHAAAGSIAALTAGTARLFLLIFVFLYAKFYFLLGGPEVPERILRYVPLSPEDQRRLGSTFTSVARATLVGAVVIGVIQGALAGAGLFVVGIHGVLFWTAIMAVMSIVPGIGTAIVWVPAVIYLALDGRYGAAIGLGLWCAVVVGSVDNFLRPRLVGKGTQLPNLLVLLGTLGGLFFFGPVGVILGPVVAALFMTVWQLHASTTALPPAGVA